ncbi:putative serine protease K12H4.7 [Orussus abietinus]|uniref:putative serine protease K12H4.7 n=1 Tax=Orussus abietinus TaxID=222816 RepID=UPI0006257F10|nr:putative serine protease K12H4.7 [Orussus abietinus]
MRQKMRLALALVSVALLVDFGASWRTFTKGRARGGNVGAPKLSKHYDLPPDQWIEQNLDHFNPTETRTWLQRYFVNTEYYKQGGPIFLMISGESTARAEWMAEGEWIEYAKQFGAMCFQVEHRFYGKSHPTSDLSVKNLMFLSSEQALADLAYFIKGMNKLHNIPENTKWIAFGGSYAGSLAAWLRSKYPHLVHGAVSSSGPLLAEIDFQQYFVIVEESLKKHSQACVDMIETAIHQIDVMMHHRVGQAGLTEKFNLCDPLDPAHTKPKDVANFYETLAGNFAEVVQYNKDNRNSTKKLNHTIDDVCNHLVDERNGIPIDRLAAMSNSMLKASDEKCLNYRYAKMLDELRNVSWADEAAAGGRQWTYQTCTEFGFFQTSSARPKLFSNNFPVNFFVQQCTDIFGPRYNVHLLSSSVVRTNTLYGALDLEVTNVVFVHGSVDPWHALGLTDSKSPSAPSIYIDGTAHCANMYPPSPDDLPQLKQARQQVGHLIGTWLQS